jgi:hypothetical protein
MSSWKGGEAERRKFGGRMLLLVCHQASGKASAAQCVQAAAAHVKGLTEYMVSRSGSVVCTPAAHNAAKVLARALKHGPPSALPASVVQQPEGAFQELFRKPKSGSRDTVVLVAEAAPLLYWLMRALQLGPAEATAASGLYDIVQSSVTMVNVRADNSCKVVCVGDAGLLPVTEYTALPVAHR